MRTGVSVVLLVLSLASSVDGFFGALRKETSVAAGPRSDLGCSTVSNSQWQRLLCFSHLREAPVPPLVPGIITLKLNLTITVTKNGGDPVPACGDSLDIRFTSTRALFAPTYREVSCGVHELSMHLPPDAPEWDAEVYIVHIDGEGLQDPPVPRPFPNNLVNFNEGPTIYNLRAKPFEGRLHAPAWYVKEEGIYHDAYAFRSAQDPNLFALEPTAALPWCTGGDAPGRWVFHHSIYPDVEAEPLQWRPYGCKYRRIKGWELQQCVESAGQTQLSGESTMGQAYELMLAHMAPAPNGSNYYWPKRIEIFEARALWRKEGLRAADNGNEYHGSDHLLQQGPGDLRRVPPDILVLQQGANDAARDSIAKFKERLREFLTQLKEMVSKGEVKPRVVVWATPPTRQYKSGGLPGRIQCLEGSRKKETCLETGGGDFRIIEGQVQWWQIPTGHTPLQFFGTIDRRRAMSRFAIPLVKEFFPNALVVDYEALTAALPSDYCIDGEHWGCPRVAWQGRQLEPYQCRSLGNIVFANILANIICANPRPSDYTPVPRPAH